MEKRSSELVPFAFGDSLVRVIEDENGNPWLVAKDVIKALGYSDSSNPSRVIAHVPDEWKGVNPIHTPSGVQEMWMLSEQGLYFFLGRSDKPAALPFQKWLAGDVIPSIRKTGRYETPRRKTVTGTPIPESMIEISLNLKPAMRQRLWRDALDTARQDGGGIELICQCFESLCGMMSAKRKVPHTGSLITQFMDERLEEAAGFTTPFGKIEQVFNEWWQEFGTGTAPGPRLLASYLRSRFASYKSSVIVYRDCRLCEA